jgi:ABC-type antimicrobial peptide transport system permease subunit
VGTVVTFVFVILLLQIVHLIAYAHPPFINTARTIHMEDFNTKDGKYIRGIPPQDMEVLFRNTSGVEAYSISDHESINAEINGRFRPLSANFINADYFTINRFDFMEGRGFDGEDIANKKPYAVVTKRIAEKYFQQSAIAKKVTIQEIEYQIIGVVDNYASVLNPHESANVWLPYIFNKFVPSCNYFYNIDVLFATDMSIEAMKENLFQSLSQYFRTKKMDVDLNKNTIYTIQEEKINLLGGNQFTHGVAIVIVLLLTIPAINIMALNLSNTYNRVPEIAVRRAVGSGKLASFAQIIIENFIVVCLSLVTAFILIVPTLRLIENLFFNTDSVPLLTTLSIRFPVLCITLLLAIIYTLLSGSIPAYVVANKNIATILNGGEQ